MTNHIFLSYSQQDEGKIPSILKNLREREIYSGNELSVMTLTPKEFEDARQGIKRTISQADTVVIVWTPAGARSDWVNYEAGMADALGKRIIVVRPDENSPALPANFDSTNVQVVDLAGSPIPV